MNALAAIALALLALSRLGADAATERTVGHVAALLVIAAAGYRFAATGRVPISWTLIAFAIAWFWMPIVPLLALVVLSVLRKPAVPASTPQHASAGQAPDAGQSGDAANALFTLRTAAEEFKDRVKAFAVDVGSIYGSRQIPMIVDVDGREHGVYVETAAWDRPATIRFYKWMAALRTSDREDLPMLIRSPHPVPIEVSRYAQPTPGNAFELAGAMNVSWTDTPGFAELNAATVKRLLHEYFDVTLTDTIDDLERVDRLVAGHLSGRGEPLASTLILLGCYFGEVLVRQLHGTWVIAGQTTADVRVDVVTPRGSMEANVFGKASKLLRSGMEDSMAWMARSIQDRMQETDQGHRADSTSGSGSPSAGYYAPAPTKRVAVLWRHELGKEGRFQGTFLDVIGERAVFIFNDGDEARLRCLDRNGATKWDHTWPDLSGYFRCDGHHVYCGGDLARRIDVVSGEVTTGHRFASHADPMAIFADGPVYETEGALIGLRKSDLGLSWEMPNEKGDIGTHQDRLCRLTTERLTMFAPPSMQETTLSFDRPAVVDALHVHHEGLICQFGLTAGGRKAFDAVSGKEVWASATPENYGLIVFDESSGFVCHDRIAAYDLRTGAEKWTRPMIMTTPQTVKSGRLYGGGYHGWTPIVYVIDAKTGAMLLEADFDHRLTGLGFEPSPVRPMGADRLIVGLRDAIACVALT